MRGSVATLAFMVVGYATAGARAEGYDTWYVDAEYGDDGSDGSSWGEAFETLQAAIGITNRRQGDVILVRGCETCV